MADLQSLVANQDITPNWPEDYPYHPLRDDMGNPAIIRVADEYLSAWLTRGADGQFTEVTVLNETQLGRIYDDRPGADQSNVVATLADKVWADDRTGQKWPADDFEEVIYNTRTGEVLFTFTDDIAEGVADDKTLAAADAARATMFQGNADWVEGGQQGMRPFNRVVLAKGLAADGVSDADLDYRLPADVTLENNRALIRSVDSANKAHAESILSGAEGAATRQLERVRMQLAEPSLVYSHAASAEGFGVKYEQGLQGPSFDLSAQSVDELLSQLPPEEEKVHPGIAPGALAGAIEGIQARQEAALAELVAQGRPVVDEQTAVVDERVQPSSVPSLLPEAPALPAVPDVREVLRDDLEIKGYTDEVIRQYGESAGARNAQVLDQYDEIVAGLNEQLSSIISPENLGARIEKELRFMGVDETQIAEFLVSDGFDRQVASLQNTVGQGIASGAFEPDIDSIIAKVNTEIRAEIPGMVEGDFERAMENAQGRIDQRFNQAAKRQAEAMAAAAEAANPEDIEKQRDAAMEQVAQTYASQLGAYSEQQRAPILNFLPPEVIDRINELWEEQAAEGGSQPALQGAKP